MSELIAVAFDNPTEADNVLTELRRLQREYLIDLEDAVVAVRRPDGEVQLKQSVNLIGASAASGGVEPVPSRSAFSVAFAWMRLRKLPPLSSLKLWRVWKVHAAAPADFAFATAVRK